jgi:hemoglobin-like flavoprotein
MTQRGFSRAGLSRHKFAAAISRLANHLIKSFAAYGEAIYPCFVDPGDLIYRPKPKWDWERLTEGRESQAVGESTNRFSRFDRKDHVRDCALHSPPPMPLEDSGSTSRFDTQTNGDKRRHPMTPESQNLVRDSFAKIEPLAAQAAAIFYDRLFVLDPSLKPLFKSDMTEQGRMLMAMIGAAVANLGNLEAIIPAVQDLGRRHATYGVEPRHYATVGAALLWTLEQGLGDAFTQPVKAAWMEAYTVLSAVMQKGANGSLASPGR